MYENYVVYYANGKFGAIFIGTSAKYETKDSILALSKYISGNFCEGKDVILLNVMRLKSEADECNGGGDDCDT